MTASRLPRPLARVGLVATATLALCLVRVALQVAPFRTVKRAVDAIPALLDEPASAATAACTVDVVDRRLPGTGSCLDRALVVQAVCALLGHETRLRIGVRRKSSVLRAHAWVEAPEGTPISPDPGRGYAPLEPA